jgi:hypothetical protein
MAVVVAVLGAGGCSGAAPEPQPPRVASLVEPSAAASASASATRQRPRDRLDDTEADFEALRVPYRKCMKGQGVTGEKEISGWGSGDGLPKKQRAAQQACEMFWPLPPWELDPANPEAKDFARDVVKCLKSRGVRYVEPGENGIGVAAGGPQNDARSIAQTGELLDDCEREVAGRR